MALIFNRLLDVVFTQNFSS